MKGEYVEPKTQARHNHNNMFSKLQPHHHSHSHSHHHQQQHHQQHQQQHHQLHPFANHFQQQQQQQQVTSTTSEEADDTATTTAAAGASTQPQPDGATIEVVRRPRGRPPGSKNKPKPPVIITRDTEPAMSPYILEVPAGSDVVEAISKFCRRKGIGLCVLSGSGAVSNVTLRQPSTTPGATVTFHGRFDVLSLTATFLPQPAPSCPPIPAGFTISLAGPQGQIVGGLVAGALVAAGTVYIVGASFNNPSYHRLPAAEDDGRDGAGRESPAGSGGGGESGGHAPSVAGEMGMFGCHVPSSDVIWAPTARQPPPPPPPGY